VLVQTGTEQATLKAGFNVSLISGPLITDFNPKSAPVGTLVIVTGNKLSPNPQVTLNRQGSGTISAPVSDAQATSISFVIPARASTGPITVTVDSRPISSSEPLTITASKEFGVTALPSTTNLIEGQSVSFAVNITSATQFTQLATLS